MKELCVASDQGRSTARVGKKGGVFVTVEERKGTDGFHSTYQEDLQLGEMDAEIVDNMWEDWGLCNALDASLSCRQPWVPRGPMQGWLAQQHARAQRGT